MLLDTDYDIIILEDYATIKYNSNGEQQWLAKYNSASDKFDIAALLTTDNAGNVFVTGYIATMMFHLKIITIKYNSNGEQQWISLYNGTGNDF